MIHLVETPLLIYRRRLLRFQTSLPSSVIDLIEQKIYTYLEHNGT